jgi:molybdate transport system substrate-binding protein
MANRRTNSLQLTVISKLLILLALAPTGCSRDDADRPVVVSAAASTKDLMTALVKEYQLTLGGVTLGGNSPAKIVVNAGATSQLATQIIAGAPVDLFLSANESWAEEMLSKGLVSESVNLLGNQLVLAVPNTNVGMVASATDLLDDKVRKIGVAGENVPAGIYAKQVLTRLGMYDQLSTDGKVVFGHDVRSVLAFLERHEVDAGIVYASDCSISKEIQIVQRFAPALHDRVVYVLMLMKPAEGQRVARDFYKFMRSERAINTIERFGFSRINETSLQDER